MSYPRFAVGYTFRADVTFTADYDGGGATNIDWFAGEHFDTIDDLVTEMEGRIDTACGSAMSIFVITAAGVDQGKVYIDAGVAHTIAVAWGAPAENVRLRNYLGWAADLAPAAQTFLAPAAHTGRWFPNDEGAIQSFNESAAADYGAGRTSTFGTIYYSPSIRDYPITLRALAMTAGDFTQVVELLTFFDYVANGETFGIYRDRAAAAHTVNRLAMSFDALAFSMDSPPDDRRWVVDVPLQVIP